MPREPTPMAQLTLSALDDDRVKAELDAVRDLFSRRPVWRRKKLAEELAERHEDASEGKLGDSDIFRASFAITGLTGAEISLVLPMVAFEVVTGPWRRTWVRFGHDIRADPRSRFLQVIETLKPGSSETNAAKSRSAATIQLCDLESRAAQDIVLNAPRARSCDPHTGWFSRKLLEDVLKQLADRTTDDDQDALAWREFIDVAAVADLKTQLLPELPPDTHPSRKRRRTQRHAKSDQEEDDEGNDDEEEEQDEDEEDDDGIRNEETPNQELGTGSVARFANESQASTGFAILGEDDDNDED